MKFPFIELQFKIITLKKGNKKTYFLNKLRKENQNVQSYDL